MTVEVKYLHPRANEHHVGMIPEWLNEGDPRSATEQLHMWYGHGGGWHPFKGFRYDHTARTLTYPGDPALHPIAEMHLREEVILMYEHAWVAVVQPDGSHEVCRMD